MIIANTTVLSNFAGVGHLDLLRMIYTQLYSSTDSVALTQGMRISGTPGCLLCGVQQQHVSIEDANLWLALMIAQGYYSPVNDLGVLIGQI